MLLVFLWAKWYTCFQWKDPILFCCCSHLTMDHGHPSFGWCLYDFQFVFPCSLFISQSVLVANLNDCVWIYMYGVRSDILQEVRLPVHGSGTFKVCVESMRSLSETAGCTGMHDILQKFALCLILTITFQGRHDLSHFKEKDTEAQWGRELALGYLQSEWNT